MHMKTAGCKPEELASGHTVHSATLVTGIAASKKQGSMKSWEQCVRWIWNLSLEIMSLNPETEPDLQERLSFRINPAPSEVSRSLPSNFKWEWIRPHTTAPLTTIGLEESFFDINPCPSPGRNKRFMFLLLLLEHLIMVWAPPMR